MGHWNNVNINSEGDFVDTPPGNPKSPQEAVIDEASGPEERAASIAPSLHYTLEETYEGKGVRVRNVIREVTVETETVSIPDAEEIDLSSVEDIDPGPSDDLLKKVEDGPMLEMSRRARLGGPFDDTEEEHSVVTKQHPPETCDECDGSGDYCKNCSGTGEVECPKASCTRGTIKSKCGCAGTKRVSSSFKSSGNLYAETGEVLTTCAGCAGDGYKRSNSGRFQCSKCGGYGKTIDPCPNCSGDGIADTRPCSRCTYGTASCQTCDGTGATAEYTCPTCNGYGETIEQERSILRYTIEEHNHYDADQAIQDHAEVVRWEELEATTFEDGLSKEEISRRVDGIAHEELAADDGVPPGEREMCQTRVIRRKSIAYKMAVRLSPPSETEDGTEDSSDDDSVTMIVSGIVVESAGDITFRSTSDSVRYLISEIFWGIVGWAIYTTMIAVPIAILLWGVVFGLGVSLPYVTTLPGIAMVSVVYPLLRAIITEITRDNRLHSKAKIEG